MMKAYFSSDPKTSLLKVVDDFLLDAIERSRQHTVALEIMLFSFTDDGLAARLQTILTKHPRIELRILADWGNISTRDNRKLLGLKPLLRANAELRFKFDLPYVWDQQQQKLRWNYHASLGLLHHKSIYMTVDGLPHALLCGSFNWTKTGAINYENLVAISAKSRAEREILRAVSREFNTLWSNRKLSKTYAEAALIKSRVARWYSMNPEADFTAMQAAYLRSVKGSGTESVAHQKLKVKANSLVAFSSNNPMGPNRQKGLALANAYRQFEMHKPAGHQKWVPLDIQTIALDLIYSSMPGQEICLCMYAFSPRVPEYTAILEMARKGVSMRIILDRKSNRTMIQKLREVAQAEQLDIVVKSGSRGMHQKYMFNTAANILISGTANMSTDSYYRHFEHRLLIRSNKKLITAFKKDFERIWSRLAPQLG